MKKKLKLNFSSNKPISEPHYKKHFKPRYVCWCGENAVHHIKKGNVKHFCDKHFEEAT